MFLMLGKNLNPDYSQDFSKWIVRIMELKKYLWKVFFSLQEINKVKSTEVDNYLRIVKIEKKLLYCWW